MCQLNQLSTLMPNLYFWKKNLDLVYIDFDKNLTQMLSSRNKLILPGVCDFEIPSFAKIAGSLQMEDQIVMASQTMHQFLTVIQYPKNRWKVALVTKLPLYDSDNKLIGTFGYGLELTELISNVFHILKGLIYSEKLMSASYIVGNSFLKKEKEEINLTSRESECLFFLLRGNTTKKIGKILKLSPRTIEQYVEILRHKFNCTTKSELISKAIEYGFLNYIPKKLLDPFSMLTNRLIQK